ncbi:MAG: hypothetical protein JWM86_884 [Thermoleophilia bacterium]|nr:hypothetical protein [Thermoleophilia bacterium]
MSVSISNIRQTVSQQSGPTSTSRFATVAKHAVIGGALGAAAGAALSFTALPFIGAFSAPIAAAIGGAAGLVLGGLIGLLRTRGSSDGAHVGARMIQSPPPAPRNGAGNTPPPPPPLPR